MGYGLGASDCRFEKMVAGSRITGVLFRISRKIVTFERFGVKSRAEQTSSRWGKSHFGWFTAGFNVKSSLVVNRWSGAGVLRHAHGGGDFGVAALLGLNLQRLLPIAGRMYLAESRAWAGCFD